jgi:hypothetical protein
MPTKDDGQKGGDVFIVDNSDKDWKVRRYLHDWADLAHTMDIATGYFEIGGLLALDGQWQKVDKFRILMGDEVSRRTKRALAEAVETAKAATRIEKMLTCHRSRPLLNRRAPRAVQTWTEPA